MEARPRKRVMVRVGGGGLGATLMLNNSDTEIVRSHASLVWAALSRHLYLLLPYCFSP